MSPAFSQFDEPMAWLIRGLVEYGWVDATRAGGYLPSGVFGGFNLLSLTEASDDGRGGLKLEVPALSGGRMCEDDGTYVFTAQVVRSGGGKAIALRCPEANYIQEFPYDPANPGWVAGYVHQALSEYVPQFVEWRLAGGEVPWAERRGMPTFDGESVGFLLLRFLKDKVQRNQRLDHGPAQGWWLDGAGGPVAAGRVAGSSPVLAAQQQQATAAPAAPNPFAGGGIASMGKGGGDPVYMSAEARANIGVGMGDPGNRQALARLQGPGNALLVTSGLGAFQGLLWFINGITVIAFYSDQLFALAFSAFLGLVLIPLGAAAGWGAWQYRQAKSGPFPWVAMAFAALTPGCCLGGIPVAVWAYRTWRDPMVQRARGAG
jgi:hypothetical protein